MLSTEEKVDIDDETEPITLQVDHFHGVLLGGDQLTCARIRSSQKIRENSPTGSAARLEGLIPVIEDWHAGVCFMQVCPLIIVLLLWHNYNHAHACMQVIWKRLYGHHSHMDGGTLLQLRNLLNRSSVPKDPKSNVNATEDFIEVTLIGHVIAAAMEVLGMKGMEDQPAEFPNPDTRLSAERKMQELSKITRAIVDRFVNLSVLSTDQSDTSEPTVGEPQRQGKKKRGSRKKKKKTTHTSTCESDGVYEYAREYLTLGLLYSEFKDAVKEGDGNRVVRCWRFFLLYFKASHRKNYSIEALNLLAQYNLLLPPRLAEQLKWSRFINVSGKPGHNIACDLHLEHINCACKFAIAGLGANTTPQAITRVGKCIGPLMKICTHFDEVFGLHTLSSAHPMPDISKDVKRVVKELTETSSVFKLEKGRYHTCFKSVRCSLYWMFLKKMNF